MDNMQVRLDRAADAGRTGGHGRSFAKDIAELALFLDLTEPNGDVGHLEAATAEIAAARRVPATTLKRCASEARALIEYGQDTGALRHIASTGRRDAGDLRQAISAWLDDTNLSAVLKQRALRLNRRRGGRPASSTRTLRAVQELVAFARAGRRDALDELRSIKALIGDA